jgi:hypothetical protein
LIPIYVFWERKRFEEVGFEIPTAVTMNSSIFSDATPTDSSEEHVAFIFRATVWEGRREA